MKNYHNVKTILSVNSKTGYSLNFNPCETCLSSCPIKDFCYGKKGRFNFKNVKLANTNRLNLYKKHPEIYFERLKSEIIKLSNRKKNPIKHIRINGNGDTPSLDFAKRLFTMVRLIPDVRFWIASRKTDIFELLNTPDNCIVRYSIGIKPLSDNQNCFTSSVNSNPAKCNCRCNIDVNILSCKDCNYKCFNKNIKCITYLKH